MWGDSETLIPEGLERPSSWPEFSIAKERKRSAQGHAQQTGTNSPGLVHRLTRSSQIAFGFASGKITISDSPLGVSPYRDDQKDLRDRAQSQLRLIEDIKSEAEVAERNFDVPQLIRRLERYEAVLNEGLTNWYKPDDAVSSIHAMMLREDAADSWDDGLLSDLERLKRRHQEMRSLLQPVQPPSNSKLSILPPPAARLPSDPSYVTDTRDALAGIFIEDEMKEAVEPAVVDYFDGLVEEIDEARAQDVLSPDQARRKNTWIVRVLTKAAIAVATIIGAIATGVAISALTSVEAGMTLLTRFQYLIDFLTKLF